MKNEPRHEERRRKRQLEEPQAKEEEDLGTYHVGTSVVSATLLLVCALPLPLLVLPPPLLLHSYHSFLLFVPVLAPLVHEPEA